MPARASNLTPYEALTELKRQWVRLKLLATSKRQNLGRTVPADVVLALRDNLVAQRQRIIDQQWLETPGLSRIARDQENDPAYDVAAEHAAVDAAIAAVIAQIDLLAIPTYTAAQTADLRAALDTLAGLID